MARFQSNSINTLVSYQHINKEYYSSLPNETANRGKQTWKVHVFEPKLLLKFFPPVVREVCPVRHHSKANHSVSSSEVVRKRVISAEKRCSKHKRNFFTMCALQPRPVSFQTWLKFSEDECFGIKMQNVLKNESFVILAWYSLRSAAGR